MILQKKVLVYPEEKVLGLIFKRKRIQIEPRQIIPQRQFSDKTGLAVPWAGPT